MWEEIPPEVCSEILSRVPAEPLLRFRSVCKAWRDAIDDPIFIKMHLDRQLLAIQDSSNGVGQLILRGDLDASLYSLSLESLNSNGSKLVEAMLLKHNPSYEWSKQPVGSCNGVMLIAYSNGDKLLWNPLTRESHKLPPLKVMSKKLRGLYHSVSGLGYDSAADNYKVVKIAQVFDPRDRILKSETLVYSLKLDSWRGIEDFPYRISRLSGGVFFEGALHWISSTMPLKCTDDLIIGLDLVTEDYRLLPMPSELYGQEKPSAKHLGVLGGCLILSCYYQIDRLEVWVMKDYELKDSWIKLFSVAVLDNIGAVETLRPVAYSRCKGNVLLQHDKKEFIWYNLETKLVEKISVNGRPVTFSSQLSLPSLVRLNANGGSNRVKRPEREQKEKC